MAILKVKKIPSLLKQIDDGYQPKYDKKLQEWALNEREPNKQASPAKVFDGEGLIMIHKPHGSTGWRFKYRFEGTEKQISLGPYPTVGLAKARDKRDKAKDLLSDGIDPSADRAKKLEAAKAKKNANKTTFAAVAAEWSADYHGGKSPSTKVRNARLVKYLVAELGKLPMADIRAKHMKTAIERIKPHGIETAHRCLTLSRLIFGHATYEEYITGDPTAGVYKGIRKKLGDIKDNPFEAIIDPQELGKLIGSIWNYQGYASTVAALKILPYVFTRPGELRQARWSEINFETAEWIIPKERMKSRNSHPIDHLVPLAPTVIKILKVHKNLELDDDLVFASLRGNRPLSENAFRVALLNLGYPGNVHTAHGFRKSASSLLQKLKYDQRIIDKQLSHAVPGVSGKYALYDYQDERKKMMKHWASYLDSLRKSEKVVSIKQGKAS